MALFFCFVCRFTLSAVLFDRPTVLAATQHGHGRRQHSAGRRQRPGLCRHDLWV